MKRREQKIRAWAVVFWLFVWQAAAMLLRALYPHGALLLASPLSSLAKLISLAATKTFWQSVGMSATHIFGGFLLSCALAVMLAALSARFRRAEELLAPLVAVVKAVPVASFIILALVWLESRQLPLFIAALMAFPVVYRNVLEGIRGTSVNTCADILLAYGCRNAINMDGGSSAILWYDGEYITQSSSVTLRYTGGRPLPNAWVYG